MTGDRIKAKTIIEIFSKTGVREETQKTEKAFKIPW
jgi:hypothetical protein